MTFVSNSEVETYNTCEWQHLYSFGLGLQPKELKAPLEHGILGHKVFKPYYMAKKAGLGHEECIAAGMQVITKYMATHRAEKDRETINIVSTRFLQYTNVYKDETWRILDVEGVYTIPLEDGNEYAMTLDLLVEETAGPFKGEQIIVDFKWVYNYLAEDEVDSMPQLPKYIWTINKLGGNVKRGIYSQVRYRRIKDAADEEFFKRRFIIPTKKKQDGEMREHIKSARRILKRKQLPIVEQREEATKARTRMICKFCDFRGPCNEEVNGSDPTTTLRINYEPRTYGYSDRSNAPIRGNTI